MTHYVFTFKSLPACYHAAYVCQCEKREDYTHMHRHEDPQHASLHSPIGALALAAGDGHGQGMGLGVGLCAT